MGVISWTSTTLEEKEAFLAFSRASVVGSGGIFREGTTEVLSVLALREGNCGGRTELLEREVIVLAVLDTDTVLFTGGGLSETDFMLVLGSVLVVYDGNIIASCHAGTFTSEPCSSDFVLVAVTRAIVVETPFCGPAGCCRFFLAGRGGALRLGRGGGPLGVFAIAG